MKKKYESLIMMLLSDDEMDCILSSNDNWQDDPNAGGWGDWTL